MLKFNNYFSVIHGVIFASGTVFFTPRICPELAGMLR